MVVQVVNCMKEAGHLFLQFEKRVLGKSPIALRGHVQSLPVGPGGPGLGHPSASWPHLSSLEVLNRTEWTLPNPPSAGPGRREREFPGPHSDWRETEVSATPSTRPRAWSPWSWLAPGADPTVFSSKFQEPILRGCRRGEGAPGGWEKGRERGKFVCEGWAFSSRPTLFPSFLLRAFLGHFIRGRYPAKPLVCFHLIESSQKPREASSLSPFYRPCLSSKSIY